ncbi:MAG: Ribosomal RNA large subunit methyltransferase G [Glaciecola sp. HTCC2999]|nr:MAG: Ribosomal RNA large subunit methyltransferase G [Glaciecola sp. HTCC2999]
MNIEFTHARGTHTLVRYPAEHQHKSLQAWDAVDEYIISYVQENHTDLLENIAPKRIAIFNDDFGALTCAFHAFHPIHISDSLVAQLGARHNMQHNELDPAVIDFIASTEAIEHRFDIVLMQLPKNLALLTYQLHQLRQCSDDNTIIIAGGKVPVVTKNIQQLFHSILGNCHTSLAVKKSRLVIGSMDPQLTPPPQSTWNTWEISKPVLQLSHLPNVFSRLHLDIGARFLMQHLPLVEGEHVVDLGCGNGVIGCSVLADAPNATITFVDESYMAIESAKRNVQDNFPDQYAQCNFVVANCLSQVDIANVDLVLCNPPFHQQNAVTDHIAWQMFKDAKQVLRHGGELRIIGNRHLPYGNMLKKRYGGFTVIATNAKFSILSTYKSDSSRK